MERKSRVAWNPQKGEDGEAEVLAGLIDDDEGELKLSLSAYMDVVKSLGRERTDLPEVAFVIPRLAIDGHATQRSALLKFTFQVEVVAGSKWVSVPLLSSSLSLLKTSVTPAAPAASGTPPAYFALNSDHHTLMLCGKGRYEVVCEAEAPIGGDRKRALALDVPRASVGHVTFSAATEGGDKPLQITCSPCLSSRLTNHAGKAELTASFAPTTRLTIQWTELVVASPEEVSSEPDQKEEEIVTCSQETIHSVGEGVLLGTASFSFSLVHAPRSSFLVVVDDRIKIVQVEAEGMKRWRVVEGDDAEGDGKEEIVTKRKMLSVELHYAVVDSYVFHVTFEMDMDGTSVREMALPILWCRNVSRERCHMLVEARTNVEVEEVESSGVTPVDISELPSAMKSSSNPLAAYKTLFPKASFVSINVTKHQDTEVLVTAIESAHFEVTVASEGKCLHRVRMNVQNTQRQYLRVTLPKNRTIWSTVVGGQPMKPAVDEQGNIMVPLSKTRGGAKQTSFVVDLVFLVQMEPMQAKGSLAMEFPKVDIPINYLMVTLWLPKKYKYSDATGNIEQVKSFSRSVYFRDAPMPAAAPPPVPQQNMMRQYSNESMSSAGSISFALGSSMRQANKPQMAKSRVVKTGMVPVKVNVPLVGVDRRFEKLLVTDGDEQRVVLPYKELKPAKKRCLC